MLITQIINCWKNILLRLWTDDMLFSFWVYLLCWYGILKEECSNFIHPFTLFTVSLSWRFFRVMSSICFWRSAISNLSSKFSFFKSEWNFSMFSMRRRTSCPIDPLEVHGIKVYINMQKKYARGKVPKIAILRTCYLKGSKGRKVHWPKFVHYMCMYIFSR